MRRGYILLVFVLFVGIVFSLGDRGGRVTLEEADGAVIPDGEGKVLVNVRGDQVKFKLQVRGLPYLIDTGDYEGTGSKEYHFYEAWLITEENEMISMGAFNVDRKGRAKLEYVFDINQARDREGNLIDLMDINKAMVTVEKQDANVMPGEIILEGEF